MLTEKFFCTLNCFYNKLGILLQLEKYKFDTEI